MVIVSFSSDVDVIIGKILGELSGCGLRVWVIDDKEVDKIKEDAIIIGRCPKEGWSEERFRLFKHEEVNVIGYLYPEEKMDGSFWAEFLAKMKELLKEMNLPLEEVTRIESSLALLQK